MNRQQIIEYARGQVGTPYHHQARLPGVALDCIGLVTATLDHFGLPWKEVPGYRPVPDGKLLVEHVSRWLDPVDRAPQPGDVGVFWFASPSLPTHTGIFSDLGGLGLIHTYTRVRRVVEVQLDEYWQKRLHSVYSFRGVED